MVAWYMKDGKPERRLLNVPFDEKEEAKAIGAQWDALIKKWWIPFYVPVSMIPKDWLLKNKEET